MSVTKDLEAPYTLASLPKPIDSTNGQTQVAGVCSLTGSKKRKRTEVAVGIDGEGVFIYSVQNPQLVTSYAVPPQTYFSSAPCSLYRKGTTKCRFTYASIAQSTPGEKPQIICFTEKFQKDQAQAPVKSAYTLSDSTKIVSIEILPTPVDKPAKSSSHDVLVVFDDGKSICLSSDLKELRWEVNLRPLSSSDRGVKAVDGFHVEYLSLTTAKAALRGFFKTRGDIASILDPSLEGTSDLLDATQLLCVILRRHNKNDPKQSMRMLGLFQLQPRSSDIITSHLPPIKHLLTWELPHPEAHSSEFDQDSSFSLHPNNGKLHQLQRGVLFSYDFSDTVPKVYSELEVPGSGVTSFSRVSSDLILTVSQDSCGIYDVKYNSVQAALSLEADSGTQNASKKRKQPEDGVLNGALQPPRLITYFTELGLAVGLSDHELVGIQLVGSHERKRLRVEGSLLVDSLGKGLPSGRTHSINVNHHSVPQSKLIPLSQNWQKKVSKLDKFAAKNKVPEFEELLADEMKIDLLPNAEESTIKIEPSGESDRAQTPLLTNGVTDDEGSSSTEPACGGSGPTLQKWDLPKVISGSQRYPYWHQAIYALGKIFTWNTDAVASQRDSDEAELSPSAIRIEFFAPNVFQWLLIAGFLTKDSIQRALLEASPKTPYQTASISDGDIVKAIVEYDPELHILSAVLNNSTVLPVGEIVQAIKVVIQSLNDRPNGDSKAEIANGVEFSKDAMDVDVLSELEAATHDLDHALSILDNGVAIRSNTLRPALVKLHEFPAPAISAALRRSLSRPELESLIRLLHSEFKNGGWTSPYNFLDTEQSSYDDNEGPNENAVAIIASLLSCSLDAIGTGAWLATATGSDSDDSTEQIIRDLYLETDVALNGFWEARFIRGLLSEFLRYADKCSKTRKPSNKTLQKQGKPLISEDVEEESLPMLPLGGKVDAGVEKTKIGKGGKNEERSTREMGMLISKKVPKYRLERIVL
jgi:hypothetical protein